MYGIYIYCGIKEKHPEFFSELNSLKLQRKKRKDAVGHLESQLQSMEQFSTNSVHQFAKNLAARMYDVDESYKKNKPKLMRDVRLLRESLYGKIPPVTTNDTEQLRILIARCKRSKQLHADDSPQSSVSGRSEEFFSLSRFHLEIMKSTSHPLLRKQKVTRRHL